jgi:CRP-like cAMP-binding protein
MTQPQDNTYQLMHKVLGSVKVFRNIAPDDLKELLQYAKSLEFAAGQCVLREGDPTREFYVVLAGEFVLLQKAPNGERKIVSQRHPGDSFGELAFCDGEARDVSAYTIRDGVLLAFSPYHIPQNHNLALQLYVNISRELSRRLRGSNLIALSNDEAFETAPEALQTLWS